MRLVSAAPEHRRQLFTQIRLAWANGQVREKRFSLPRRKSEPLLPDSGLESA
jgi:hypothetical protein